MEHDKTTIFEFDDGSTYVKVRTECDREKSNLIADLFDKFIDEVCKILNPKHSEDL